MAISNTLKNTESVIDIDNLPEDFGEPPLSWPEIGDIDFDEVAISYYAPYDLLSIDFHGGPLPAINMPLDPPDSPLGYAEARIGLANETVVGIEITGYRSEISDLHPRWRNLLTLSGDARRAALRDLIEFVSAMPVYDGPPNDKL